MPHGEPCIDPTDTRGELIGATRSELDTTIESRLMARDSGGTR